jgi:hypothetical protein
VKSRYAVRRFRGPDTRDLPAYIDTMRPSVLEAAFLSQGLASVGERDRALTLLERVRPRSEMLWFVLRWPEFDPLRDDPRFQRLVEETKP